MTWTDIAFWTAVVLSVSALGFFFFIFSLRSWN